MHSAPQMSRRKADVTTIVVALQTVVILSLLVLAGSDLARRLHPVSSGTTALSAQRVDLSAANSNSDARLLVAPDQHGRTKARPTEPSGDAILPSAYKLLAQGPDKSMAAPSRDLVLAATMTGFQPRAPPLSRI